MNRRHEVTIGILTLDPKSATFSKVFYQNDLTRKQNKTFCILVNIRGLGQGLIQHLIRVPYKVIRFY